MNQVNVLHVSDLHMCERDLPDIKIVVGALLRDLKRWNEETTYPDIVCFTGDIAFSGKAEEYELARQHFFNPLLQTLGLDRDRLFWVPGNHDVARGAVRGILEHGLVSALVSREAVNSLLDNATERREAFERLDTYASFTRDYFGALLGDHDPAYFTARTVQIRDHKIGVACLNSAWRCSGDADQGRILVGERQLDEALRSIAGADVRIGLMHHPFDCFASHESDAAENFCVREFDILLRGHLHHPRVRIQHAPAGACALIPAGAVFNHRRDDAAYIEGYLVVSVGPTCEVHLRRYHDRRREFDADVDSADGGHFVFTLEPTLTTPRPPATPSIFPEAFKLFYSATFDQKKETIRAREAAIMSGVFQVDVDAVTRGSLSPWDFDRITIYLYHEHTSGINVNKLVACIRHEVEVLRASVGNETLIPLYYAVRALNSRLRLELGDSRTDVWHGTRVHTDFLEDCVDYLQENQKLDEGGHSKAALNEAISLLAQIKLKRGINDARISKVASDFALHLASLADECQMVFSFVDIFNPQWSDQQKLQAVKAVAEFSRRFKLLPLVLAELGEVEACLSIASQEDAEILDKILQDAHEFARAIGYSPTPFPSERVLQNFIDLVLGATDSADTQILRQVAAEATQALSQDRIGAIQTAAGVLRGRIAARAEG